ncbi:hypothetical protein Pmani_031101 [Petrolisthes manimaculis]|uniref:Uncharacterized protein n=1 Tax=Petrolisthes manimaculis TaxID=1843537 RepID=A0AAE1NWB7_9EUCA|nr:hypothetical protein Pmani_031101 [Petrolisthes manimaculis]
MVKRDEEGRKMGETERGGREGEKKWDQKEMGKRYSKGVPITTPFPTSLYHHQPNPNPTRGNVSVSCSSRVCSAKTGKREQLNV